MRKILASTDIKSALRSRQRGFIMRPDRFSAGGGPVFPSSGLLHYYKLNVNSVDSLGTNSGTDTSISYANAGKIGNSATFASSRITMASGNPTTNKSVSMWVRRGDTGSTEQFLYGWFAADGVIYWRINIGGLIANKVGLFHRSAGLDYKLWDTDTITDTTTFHHIVVTQAGTANPVIYINGTSRTVTLQATSGSLVNWTGSVPHTMGRTINNTFSFTGRIDEVGRWNRILTAAEVTTLYNGGSGLTY